MFGIKGINKRMGAIIFECESLKQYIIVAPIGVRDKENMNNVAAIEVAANIFNSLSLSTAIFIDFCFSIN